jgi:uncharacterized small protein (DUF1192 family)
MTAEELATTRAEIAQATDPAIWLPATLTEAMVDVLTDHVPALLSEIERFRADLAMLDTSEDRDS